MNRYKLLFLILGWSALATGWLTMESCRKEPFSGSCALEFSTDTLTFDTVFASLGSATRSFKIYNRCKESVRISQVQLSGAQGTQFRMNLDGVSGRVFRDVEIPAQDSIYAFVEVTVDPNQINTPFILMDEVVFETNGNTQKVALQAWGQNAHFHYGEEITGNAIWTNDLPHVVVSKDTIPGVYVKAGGRLTIQAGTQVFMGPGSAIFVSGEMQVNGSSWADSVVFQGVRLESFYKDKPGQWLGLFFLRNDASAGSGSLNYCVIDEAGYGVSIGSGFNSDLAYFQNTTTRPNVSLNKVIIRNAQYSALYGFNGKAYAENCIFYAAGDNLLSLAMGGDYSFKNCTFFNRGSRFVGHQKATLLLSNFAANDDGIYPAPLDAALFENCVVYGSLEKEISFNRLDAAAFNPIFRYCLLKANQDTVAFYQSPGLPVLGCKFNTDPAFKSPDYGNFMPDSTRSPLTDASGFGIGKDIFDQIRPVTVSDPSNAFDIGAVEFHSP